jgi:NADPH:quinone reductase-like Zn-dependent oxidoreductase
LPDGLDFHDAVAALAVYPHALRCLRDGGGVQPDDRVWVEGQDSAIGAALIHLIDQFGGRVANAAAGGSGADTTPDAPDGPTASTSAANGDAIALVILTGPVLDQGRYHTALERLSGTGVVVVAPGTVTAPVSFPPAFFASSARKVLTAHVPSHKDAEAVVTWLANTPFRPPSDRVRLADVPRLWADDAAAGQTDPPMIATVGPDRPRH